MNSWNFLSGTVTVQITSADTAGTINRCFSGGIILYDTQQIDGLTVQCVIHREDLSLLKGVTEARGDSLKVIKRKGLYWTIAALRKRPVLVIGMALMIALACFLPTRVLFIQVSGNVSVPDRKILETATKCGIYFGASRSEVRSERMKNALLEAMPELQWAGVNTSGCVAVITVREREAEEKQETKKTVSSIVAVRDGIIESCTVSKGTAHCKPGQAVTKGQLLISGYTDCGITIRAETAEGEIYAQTERSLEVRTLNSCCKQSDIVDSETKFSLILGKKRINFYKGSGILDITCDRIYEENYITLPGGFVLPVAFVTERWTYYCCEETVSDADFDLSDFAQNYLLEQMVAGQILSALESSATGTDVLSLKGTYQCREMIGKVIKEEIIKPNGND